MRFAKDCLDVGCMTDNLEMVAFFRDDVGLGEPEVLPITATVTQYRFDVDGSVVKVNLVDGLETDRRSGYADVTLATGSADLCRHDGPDGISVLVEPRGIGVANMVVTHAVPDLGGARDYYEHALGWTVDGDHVRVGRSAIRLCSGGPDVVEMPVRGWTYLTAQVWNCDAETEAVSTRGASVALPPTTLGMTARISMVGDPWGNQLELSQRASLTGALSTSPEERLHP